MIDTHCHLDFPNFEKDFAEVLARARDAGVTKFINPGVDLPSSQKAVALAEKFPEIYAAVGFHPSEAASLFELRSPGAEKLSADNLTALEELASSEKVVALGEVGLDFFKMRNSKKVQVEAFEKQLTLAEKLQKPVIIHSREADEEIFQVLDNFKVRGVFHCFGGDWNFAEKVLAKGFLIGLTGIVTFPNAQNVREVAERIPLEKLLIETDAPFLAPQKYRGSRCEPAYVSEVAREIAELKNLSVAEITEKTTKNAEEFFGI
ncbi:MAG: TatD family hydrolase [Candidatus Peribacteraceae bacterium]|nr:TatD family hydrolase [Candidatus Peribacteraceae bacterium]